MNKYKKKLSKRLFLYLCGITTIIPSLAFGDMEVNNNFLDLFQNRIKAAHFLTQATMGPKRIEIIRLANRIAQIGEDAAFNEWIDQNGMGLRRISTIFEEAGSRNSLIVLCEKRTKSARLP